MLLSVVVAVVHISTKKNMATVTKKLGRGPLGFLVQQTCLFTTSVAKPALMERKYLKDAQIADRRENFIRSMSLDTKYKVKTEKDDGGEKGHLIKEVSLPNPTWTDKTRKLYDELMDLCKDGQWEKVISYQNNTGTERLFVRAVEAEGKMFEYAMFLNRKEQRLRAVVQFGPWLQGPKGAVHGGAIATMFDSVGGVLAYQLGYRCVTVNLNVSFHGFLPLHTTAECVAWLTKKEGRKIYIDAELRSLDGKTIFDRCSALWLQVAADSNTME